MTTMDRVRAYARVKGLTLRDATTQLLTIALDHLDARSAAGKAAHTGRSTAERSARAKAAATARWAAR